MAASRRTRGSTKNSRGGALNKSLRQGTGGLRNGRVRAVDGGFGDEFDLGFEDDDFGGLGGGHGPASSGSADALMALFDDECAVGDAFDDMGVGATGSQSSSSTWRGAAASNGAQSSSSTWRGAAASTGAQSSSSTWRGAASATGSQSSSSTWMGASAAAGSQSCRRPARQKASGSPFQAFVDPMDMLAPKSKSHKGKKQPLSPEDLFDPLDSLDPMDASLDQLDDLFGDGLGPEDDSDDPLLMDPLDDFQDDFPDDFHDDFLSPPRRRKQSGIVHRFNPFGRLQLPPIRRRRLGFSGEVVDLTQTDDGLPVNSASFSASAAPSAGSTGSAVPAAPPTPRKAVDAQAQSTEKLAEEVTCAANSSAAAAVEPQASSAGATAAAPAQSKAADAEESAAGSSARDSGSAAPVAPALSTAADSELQRPVKPAEELAAKSVIEEASPAPDSAVAKSLEEPLPPSTDAAEPAESTACSALLEKPCRARFAFEYFSEAVNKESGEQSVSEADLIHRWRTLEAEERCKFVDLADMDKKRYQDKYEQWCRQQEEQGHPQPPMHELISNRCSEFDDDFAHLDREARVGLSTQGGLRLVARHGRVHVASRSPSMLSRVASQSPAPEAGRRRRLRKSKPAGYPEDSRSAYKLFCGEYKQKLEGDDAVTPMGQEAAADKASVTAQEDECATADAPAEGRKRRRSTKGMDTLKKLREIWKNLSVEERQRFESMAAADKERFKNEEEAWRQEHPDIDFPEAEVESDRRTRRRQRKSRSPKPEKLPKEGHSRQRKSKPPKPEGFPEDPRSAYKIFCAEHSADACFNEVDHDAGAAEGVSAEQPQRNRGMHKLKKLREAWKNLPMEERDSFLTQAAVEEQRFSAELEAWRETQPEGGLGAAAAYLQMPRSSKLPRPTTRRPPREPLPPRGGMDSVFVGAATLKRKVDPEEEREKKQSRKPIAEAVAEVQDQQDDDDGWGDAGGAGSIDNDLLRLPGNDSHSTSLPSGTIEWGSAGSSGLPTPKSAPTAMGPTAPTESVDDLLADFMSVEDEAAVDDSPGHLAETRGAPQSFGPPGFVEEYAMTPWEEPQAPLPWTDTPDTVGAPKALGPQLCIDESGNIVLNKSSLSKKMERELPRETEDPDVPVEDVTEYKKAYRRTPATKWDEKENGEFYEALSLYGTDLFLVQTCFRNKSAAQIKAKFTREMKRFPEKVEAALLQDRRKLTVDTFERLHGKIDTSKHWRPEPTPEPGQEPDLPDGSIPGAGDGPMPEEEPEEPAEPEYTEEDESHTTNRLMALFD